MFRTLFITLAVVVGACAPSAPVSTPSAHPASSTATADAMTIEVTVLTPAAQPRLPTPLRPDGHPPAGSMAGMDPAATMGAEEAAMSHRAMRHGDDGTPKGMSSPDGLSMALNAYLTIHNALAGDRLDGVAEQARVLGTAIAKLTEAPPEDDPHFWHMRTEEVRVAQAEAATLAMAQDLNAARVAFGRLSAPFADWIEILGVPEGYDLSQFTCGMFNEAPEGGVWLQRSGSTHNPYFGKAMLTCGTHNHTLPGRVDEQGQKEHGGMHRESH